MFCEETIDKVVFVIANKATVQYFLLQISFKVKVNYVFLKKKLKEIFQLISSR